MYTAIANTQLDALSPADPEGVCACPHGCKALQSHTAQSCDAVTRPVLQSPKPCMCVCMLLLLLRLGCGCWRPP